MSVSRSIGITIDNELVERCDRLRLAGPYRHYSLKRFREMMLEIGMNKYEKKIMPIETMGEYPAPAQPETQPRSSENVIPFPGVTPDTGGGFQDVLEDFMREMGYID